MAGCAAGDGRNMKVSELINALQAVLHEHGDAEVTVTDGYENRFYRGTYTVSRFKEDDGTWAVDLGIGGCEEQT